MAVTDYAAHTAHSPLSAAIGLRVARRHTRPGMDPWSQVRWERRDARIAGEDGRPVFEQKDVEVPAAWSQLATNVVVSKYFRGHLDTPERETSVRQLIGRVVETLHGWGVEDGYFASEADALAFRDELTWLLLNQWVAFNSPVWFNVGVNPDPQCSACFINSVGDDMESIMKLAATEARLFKGGSGAGVNLSRLRSSQEGLTGGGTASGPVSFMRGFDAFAGVIKSGGKTRRAAKMVILDIDHPDVEEFINCKAEEEQKAWALIDAGYDGSFNGPAYSSVFFQNANHSVRVSDAFMNAVVNDSQWTTRAVQGGHPVSQHRARDLWRSIASAAHLCGDPGLQFDSTINGWHTCATTDRIYASNPCSEYMFLDNTACNLASLNLMKFVDDDVEFDAEAFEHAVAVTFSAMEIIVGRAGYPTPEIAANSHRYRPLGLGFANLGALLMARGAAYDSDEGRAYAGAITALMGGAAYRTSAVIAQHQGPFEAWPENRGPMLRVIGKHRDAAYALDEELVPAGLLRASQRVWDEALELGERVGYRNAQATVLAPTGTIGFMMDCDTTGVEPDIALVKYKKLVGGGFMKIVNQTVPQALKRLGYTPGEVAAITAWIDREDTIEGAPGLRAEHLSVFDCAFRAARGHRSIAPMGHVKMMAAVQPFLSGAISKTVNVPSEATVEDIADIYLEAWQLGLKAIAIYRDGCKRLQPLNVKKDDEPAEVEAAPVAATPAPAPAARPARRKLPTTRQAVTHKFAIGGHEGYLTVGLYEDGQPGEIFVVMSKQGSTISGLMDGVATSVSMALQYGVPLQVLVDKFSHQRFEPAGWTPNPQIPLAKSILDYIFRWMALTFLNEDEASVDAPALASVEEAPVEAEVEALPVRLAPALAAPPADRAEQQRAVFRNQADAPPCHVCGTLTVRNGSCYRCPNCGASTGCS